MNVNIIPQDLRQEEMLLQLEETLKNLQLISEQVFSKIDCNIGRYQKELEDIGRRADSTREKVDQLKASKNKAIKIFSSHKYPSSDDDHVLYTALCPVTLSNERTMKQLRVKSTHIPFDDQVLKEKLQFYQVPKPKSVINLIDPSDGPLGDIPWRRISSISSLVMFNSSENPYYRRSHESSLMENKSRKKIHGADETDAFAPTPLTVSTEERVTDLFKYNFDLEAAPKIFDFLPEALPDLPGIADILDPDFTEVASPSMSKPFESQLEPLLIHPDAPTRQSSQIDQVISPIVPVIVPALLGEPVTTARPNPPPPPPPLPPSSTPVEAEKVKIVSTSNSDTGRASLLDAIRKAGGKPKNTSGGASKELKIERKLEKKKEVVSADLMTDLANKLKARRTGISGANEKSSAVGAMDRVATMIPPPPKPSTSSQQDQEDSDWE